MLKRVMHLASETLNLCCKLSATTRCARRDGSCKVGRQLVNSNPDVARKQQSRQISGSSDLHLSSKCLIPRIVHNPCYTGMYLSLRSQRILVLPLLGCSRYVFGHALSVTSGGRNEKWQLHVSSPFFEDLSSCSFLLRRGFYTKGECKILEGCQYQPCLAGSEATFMSTLTKQPLHLPRYIREWPTRAPHLQLTCSICL